MMKELGLERKEDGIFGNENILFKIRYDEEKQLYVLSSKNISEDQSQDYNDIQSVLFDDTQNAKDISFVAIEFGETIRQTLGIRRKRAAAGLVDLPSASKTGAMTVSGFTKKVLDVFPQYKDLYKDHVALYGNFLYLNFFADTLVPKTVEILTENTKKSVKKLFELLETGYLQGDRETVNVTVAVIAAAVYKKPELKENALTMLESNGHFKQSVNEFIPVYARDKKLIAALNKN